MRAQSVGRATIRDVAEFEGNPVPLSAMFPGVTADDLAGLAVWHDEPGLGANPAASALEFAWRSYLVEFGRFKILIDTGLGNGKERQGPIGFCHRLGTPFLERLAGLAVTPDDIDIVICTHLHFDHVGWNTVWRDGSWVPTFPNARYLLPAADVSHYANPAADAVTYPSFVDSVAPVLDAGQAELVSGDAPAIEDAGVRLWLEEVPGHSPGSLIVNVASRGERAAFVGDLLHNPVQLVRPELSLGAEENPALSAAHRKRFLAEVADTGTLVFPAHFRGVPGGHVTASPDGGGYRWVPLPS